MFIKKGEYFSSLTNFCVILTFFLQLLCSLNIHNGVVVGSTADGRFNPSTTRLGSGGGLKVEPPFIPKSSSLLLGSTTNIVSTKHIAEQCVQKCPEQNRTNPEHLDVECGGDCYIKQCTLGCHLWDTALDSSCQTVCNKTDQELLEPKELYCVMGCNDALNRYFKWLKAEVGTPPAPALVADSLTATSLSLEWEIPEKFAQIRRINQNPPQSYLVQWRYEELAGDWKFCRNQSMGDNSTVRVDNLQPYTKYRFRVALLLSKQYDEFLTSEQSVIISTLPMGVPLSEPAIVRAVAVDHTRISVSWEPGPFPNGPILSYVLQIKDLTNNNFAIKDVSATETLFYMFEKLTPSNNYSLRVRMRNAEGEGPATVTVVRTPAQPKIKNDEPEPTLILVAEDKVMSQVVSSLLDKPPREFYSSDHRIMGIAIHIAKKWIFVSDEAGYIFSAPLEMSGGQRKQMIFSPQSGLNFKPSLMSIDWLNNHLYILGETGKNRWTILRCNLDGTMMTTAYAVLVTKPNHFEVDPYNGFLFWVITGTSGDSGLFKLDLGDISNGVKHEVKPVHLISGRNLGVFSIDHTMFRVLIPIQDINTVISISLEAQNEEDIRKNTQSPRFYGIQSLAMANGLFYWTNGHEVLTEEYHKRQGIYFHNAYLADSNRTFSIVCVNHPSVQPIPIPLNPPTEIQALMTAHKAKVSWKIPELLGNQGKGAWQDWRYEVKLLENDKVINNIKGATVSIDNLKANTEYTFRVAGYTSAGKGPWSGEFKVKTLKTPDKRFLVWSSDDGLMQSDIIGENIKTLIPKSELGGHHVTDIAWYDDTLYIVTNSTLKFFNKTNGVLTNFGEIDSIGKIAIDWIGRRLYWSNLAQQLITRSHLNGAEQDPLPFLAAAREIKIDSLRAHIYYTTHDSVETCRLNGKKRRTYHNIRYITGNPRIMSLTLDMDNQRVYWIASLPDKLSLFSAPMADNWSTNVTIEEIVLHKFNAVDGTLAHFSDRFLWLENNHTVVIGDMLTKNRAVIKSPKLTGLRAISIIDPTHHMTPRNRANINVIPEQVNNETIKVVGTWRIFNITWEPIKSVTYGQVFYEIRIHPTGYKDVVGEVTEPLFHHRSHSYQPYTALDITIRAFTYWGTASATRRHLHTPSSKPSPPTNPRVFIAHLHDPLRGGLNIEATFRWSPPAKPNGPILGYKINCWYEENGQINQICNNYEIQPTVHEEIISNLVQNVSYFFQVLAYTEADNGEFTSSLSIHTKQERPIPRVLVATNDQISRVDLDLKQCDVNLSTVNSVKFMAHIAREKRIFWINEINEVMSYNSSLKMKLATINSEVLSLAVDWVERVLYWSQFEGNSSIIALLDLNKYEAFKGPPVEFLKINKIVKNILISPMDRLLIWTELERIEDKIGQIMMYNLNTREMMEFNHHWSEKCPNVTTSKFKTYALDMSGNEAKLIWTESSLPDIYMTGLRSRQCHPLNFLKSEENDNIEFLVKDSARIYWIAGNEVKSKNDHGNKHYNFTLAKAETLLAFYHQTFPNKKCLTAIQKPKDNDYRATLIEQTEKSLKLKLPYPETHPSCTTIKIVAVKYTILYDVYHEDEGDASCDYSTCKVIYSFDDIKIIDGLKPFTKYKIQIGVNNYYGEKLQLRTILGPVVIISTAIGAPTEPRNLTVETISPTEATVTWLPPLEINSDTIWYDVHWQTENAINGVRNRQQLEVKGTTIYDNTEDPITIILTSLMAQQSYNVWVRAYSSNKTFSESKIIGIETFQEPSNITLESVSPTRMKIKWQPHENVSHFQIEYVSMTSSSSLPVVIYDSDDHGNNEDADDDDDDDDDEVDDNIEEQRNDLNNSFIIIDNLQPKTQYKFSIRLHYPKRKESYLWPTDPRFIFETLGDKPSAPGKPIVKHVSGDVYKVSWEPSKDNGAPIEEYSLEALYSKPLTNRFKRSATTSEIIDHKVALYRISNTGTNGNDSNSGTAVPQYDLPWVEEPEVLEEKWTVYYNGTDVYWIIKDLQPIHLYSFRVRARNSYGWGPYSSNSEPVSEPYVNPENRDYLLAAIFVPILVTIVIILIACIILAFHKGATDKKLKHDGLTRIPDVELANLRELPRGGNFIHSNNILYSTGPLTDSEIAALPHIRRDHITMTNFLGSGAFGEVYEGCVKNLAEPEIRVAIKTLRKGATEQEKAEFLQEAKLMSNFKHEHILRLIGVCFDHDSLYIIMELMQGGDLLSYLRQSRPSADTPSSLTLLDLVSMCVDVASGCRYLEEMHFVHRDLACRNCLVSSVDPESRVVKIGDFGLARDIYKNDYYRKEGEGLLPVRWMSPESLVDGVFTSQSDIWAFGVLCWEIMTLGQQPYPARNNVEVLHYVRDGGRLGRPTDCPDELYQLMLKCWSYSPEDRPTFRYCLEVLEALKENTNDSIQITIQNSNRTSMGGIFNRSYWLADENHNHNTGTLKFGSGDTAQPFIQRLNEPPILVTPTSSSNSPTSTLTTQIPKYLELIYDGDQDGISGAGDGGGGQEPRSIVSEGYEIPITDILSSGTSDNHHNSIINKISQKPHHNFHNNLDLECNTILRVTLPPNSKDDGCSSMDALLPHHHHQNNDQEKLKRIYLNTPPINGDNEINNSNDGKTVL